MQIILGWLTCYFTLNSSSAALEFYNYKSYSDRKNKNGKTRFSNEIQFLIGVQSSVPLYIKN
jgi:hypothetical protein